MLKLYFCIPICCALLAGCGGSGSSGASLQATPLWAQVSDKTTCEAMLPSACSGFYGFAIDNQGNYTAGPNPQGQTAKGAVTTAEWGQLEAAANAVANDIKANPNATCQAQAFIPGSSDVVQISVAGASYTVQDAMNSLCAYNGGVSDSTALVNVVDTLRTKYYAF